MRPGRPVSVPVRVCSSARMVIVIEHFHRLIIRADDIFDIGNNTGIIGQIENGLICLKIRANRMRVRPIAIAITELAEPEFFFSLCKHF